MNGYIALLGSGEYLPVMDEVDRFLLNNCGARERKPRVVCLPTAAGREGDASIMRWSKMGVEHFTRLGADVEAVHVIDKESANDLDHASAIEQADLIYFSGGDPAYLHQTLNGSLAWDGAQRAWARGAVYAGCSAGAMILGYEIPDFRAMGLRSIPVFGILPVAFVIPHFEAIPAIWKPFIFALRKRLSVDEIMIGIEEETAIVGKIDEPWTVMGKGRAHILTRSETKAYRSGETFSLGK